jgi:predicted dienelactone hydrolase
MLRHLIVSFALALALVLATPAAFADTPRAPVGTVIRPIIPDGAYNWRGAKTHALVTQIWYPADHAAVETPQGIGPPAQPLFSAGKAARNAALAPAPSLLPLIMLSHGTGGSAAMMAWLGTALAAHGYIAVAVNHPGNNGLEDYTGQGFLSWWERAHDLTTVLDKILADPMFAARVDRKRIAAAGFSLGGYTMIEIAGGLTDRAAYAAFCRSPRADGMCKPPPEFDSGLFDRNGDEELAKRDPDFAASLRRSGESYRDPRIRAVFAMAPALGPAFPAAGLRKVAIPVAIVAGSVDSQVPPATSASYFAANIPHASLTILPGVDHYVFLGECSDAGRKARPPLCADGPGVDRAAVHAKAIQLALDFFAANLR